MTTLEALARASWILWGEHWCKWTICAECGEDRVCRSRSGKRWLCLACFDQS